MQDRNQPSQRGSRRDEAYEGDRQTQSGPNTSPYNEEQDFGRAGGYGNRPRSSGEWRGENRGYGYAQSSNIGDRSDDANSDRASHRGKGPASYKRSDDKIEEMICERLTDDDDIDATKITVSVSKGEATLNGSVSSRREKYLAEDCAEHCGASEIANNLKIDASRNKAGERS